MGIFKRIRDISSAAINDVIDKAEDPVKMVSQYIRDMEDDIAEAEIAVAKQIAVEKKLKHQAEEAQEMVDKRMEQAKKALASGNEDLARRALEDKKEHEQKAEDFRTQYENAKSNADNLRAQLKEMKDEFEKMKNRKDTLVARAETAKAQKKINQTMSGFGKGSGVKGFDRMNDKVMQMEAEAEASGELKKSNRSLDDELDALGSSDVDDELAALKAELNKDTK
ncbi:PspA/IM30 family protein [Longirhabdus pacifica]|uniref:PspA/IM30 family protein n=1 Tax=Longirhabdus pacifica TaxID=2305227 RepID=UPI001008A3C3|nr:PspA/IM30 family protein [Longirhabdus pacifica]